MEKSLDLPPFSFVDLLHLSRYKHRFSRSKNYARTYFFFQDNDKKTLLTTSKNHGLTSRNKKLKKFLGHENSTTGLPLSRFTTCETKRNVHLWYGGQQDSIRSPSLLSFLRKPPPFPIGVRDSVNGPFLLCDYVDVIP